VNSTLKKIDLESIGPDGFRHIADALRVNASLKHIDLPENFAGSASQQLVREAWQHVGDGMAVLEL
jgi:hypothetical protein